MRWRERGREGWGGRDGLREEEIGSEERRERKKEVKRWVGEREGDRERGGGWKETTSTMFE